MKKESRKERKYNTPDLKLQSLGEWYIVVQNVRGGASSRNKNLPLWKGKVERTIKDYFKPKDKVSKNVKPGKIKSEICMDQRFDFMRSCCGVLTSLVGESGLALVEHVLLKFVKYFNCNDNIGDGGQRMEYFKAAMSRVNLDGDYILDQVSYSLMGEKVLAYWDTLENVEETEIYAGVTGGAIVERTANHVQKHPTAVLSEIMGLMPKEQAAVLEWAAIRQMRMLITAGMVKGGWNGTSGMERLTFGRGIEQFRLYFAKATSGVNRREVGLIRQNKKNVGKKDDNFYSLNEGIAVMGKLNHVEKWMQNRLCSNVLCPHCGKVFLSEGRMELHRLGEESDFNFKCRECGLFDNVVKLLGHRCFAHKFECINFE